MLRRVLALNSPRNAIGANSLPRVTCTCDCERGFHHGPSRSRGSLGNPAPQLRFKQNQRKPQMRDPIIKEDKERYENANSEWLLQNMKLAQQMMQTNLEPVQMHRFLLGFLALYRDDVTEGWFAWRFVPAGTVSKERYTSLRDIHGLTSEDCVEIARWLVRLGKDFVDQRVLGKHLLYAESHVGNQAASVRIMVQAYIASQRSPGLLGAPELKGPKARVERMAREGNNWHAMVLQGKIARATGRINEAIRLWEAAIDDAVKMSEEAGWKALSRQKMTGEEFAELSTPWNELAEAYLAKGQSGDARRALRIGCDQDDPNSHYNASQAEKGRDGSHVGTSKWLYHITKAAASGHAEAAHELGVFYASSGWKYIEDLPPDYIKPTPFDSFPPESEGRSWQPAFVEQLKGFIGLTRAEDVREPSDAMFHAAIFPYTAAGRMELAMFWLRSASRAGYAPSALTMILLTLEEHLSPGANAPKDAVDLSPTRYSWDTYESYMNKTPPREQKHPETLEANPYYSPGNAHVAMADLFTAFAAADYQRQVLARARRRSVGKKKGDDDDAYDLDENDIRDTVPPEVSRWFRFSSVREAWMLDQRNGTVICWDHMNNVDLEAFSKKICEENKWDIYDARGVLMYKCGLGM